MKTPARVFVAAMACMLVHTWCWAGETFNRLRSKGFIHCGVSEGLPGFSIKDTSGRWTGLDADFCRAVAAAVFGDPEKVTFVPLQAAQRFPALRMGNIDLLSRNTTWTIGREAGLGVLFAGTLYYDGQGFMVRRARGVNKVADLKGATICVEKGTTSQENLADYFQSKRWNYKPLVIESIVQQQEAFTKGQCKAFSSDLSHLAAMRLQAPGGPKAYSLLSVQISREPLGPVVRRGDEEWFTLVRWVLFALIEAEDLGVTQKNVRTKAKEKDQPELERFLGTSGNFGKALGVSNDWTVRIIESVGNYGEMFERNLGKGSPLGLERGPNRLWNKGGLLYAPPFR